MTKELDKYQITEEFFDIAKQALKDKTALQALERWAMQRSINEQIEQLDNREKRLLDMRLDWSIDQEGYEWKNLDIKTEKRLLRESLEKLDSNIDWAYKQAQTTLELLKSPSVYWNLLPYEKKGQFQKIVWSNFSLLDKKPVNYCENKLFSILKCHFVPNGGRDRARTCDLLGVNQLL